MTLVNHDTGEIVESLTKDDARRLTDRIRLIAESLAETLDKLADLIDQARVGSAWLALGYRSWTEYVSTEFAGVLPRLDREPRQEFVHELASRGMSTRAIAPVVGASFKTVARDLAPVSDDTPQTPQVERDSESGATDPAQAEATAGVNRPSDYPMAPAPAARPAVTGIDGKTYTPRPIPEAGPTAQDARYLREAMKVLGSVASIHQFDPERVAAVADDGVMQSIDAAFDNFERWREAIKSRRGRLRVVKGEIQ